MSNKVILNSLTLFSLDENYIKFASKQGYDFENKRITKVLYLAHGLINDIPFQVLYYEDKFAYIHDVKYLNQCQLNILEIFSLSQDKIKFDKKEYSSIKNKLKRNVSSMDVSNEVTIYPTLPMGVKYAIEDFNKYQKIVYDVNLYQVALELIESEFYGNIKYLEVNFEDKDIIKDYDAKFNSFVKKWYYFPLKNKNKILEKFEVI